MAAAPSSRPAGRHGYLLNADEQELFDQFKAACYSDGTPKRKDETAVAYVTRLRAIVAELTGRAVAADVLANRGVYLLAERAADVVASIKARPRVGARSKQQDFHICAAWAALPAVNLPAVAVLYRAEADAMRREAFEAGRVPPAVDAPAVAASAPAPAPTADAVAAATPAAAAAAAEPPVPPAPVKAARIFAFTVADGPAFLAAGREMGKLLMAIERTDAALAACPFAANMRTARALCDLAAFLCRRAARDGDLDRDVATELRVFAARHDGVVPLMTKSGWALCDDISILLGGANGHNLRWERTDDRPTGFNPAVRTYAHRELPTLPFAYAVSGGVTPLTPTLLRDLLHRYLLDLSTPAGTEIQPLSATWGGDFTPARTLATFHVRAFALLTAGFPPVSRTSALWEHVSAYGRPVCRPADLVEHIAACAWDGGGSSVFRRIIFADAPEEAEDVPAAAAAVPDAAVVAVGAGESPVDLTQVESPPLAAAARSETPVVPVDPEAPVAREPRGAALVRGTPVAGVKRPSADVSAASSSRKPRRR